MNMLYEKYKNLKIDGSWIGLESGGRMPCFCTPIGAEIIGGIMAYTTALLKVLEIWFSALIQKLVAITLSIPLRVTRFEIFIPDKPQLDKAGIPGVPVSWGIGEQGE